ncbi:hypothetical protein E2C01_030741 [Portunus trituberculatus]|uniref:Uncharacterized protein n=1 Tax=Portunus trituberculatus TaxID=210409 RepID=A0A5B7EVN7_PORTR|nr:hypothetical protein [Portunus trituberculatus]
MADVESHSTPHRLLRCGDGVPQPLTPPMCGRQKKIRSTQLLIPSTILCGTETIDTMQAIHEKFQTPLPSMSLLANPSRPAFLYALAPHPALPCPALPAMKETCGARQMVHKVAWLFCLCCPSHAAFRPLPPDASRMSPWRKRGAHTLAHFMFYIS